jgi:hypothetical protein
MNKSTFIDAKQEPEKQFNQNRISKFHDFIGTKSKNVNGEPEEMKYPKVTWSRKSGHPSSTSNAQRFTERKSPPIPSSNAEWNMSQAVENSSLNMKKVYSASNAGYNSVGYQMNSQISTTPNVQYSVSIEILNLIRLPKTCKTTSTSTICMKNFQLKFKMRQTTSPQWSI